MAKIDCSELSKAINDLATNIMADPTVKNIDDVVTEMQKDSPGITRQMVTESIIEVSEGRSRTIDATVKKINAIRREPFVERNTKRKIDQLNKILAAGETITPKKRQAKASKAVQLVRDIRDDLKKQIAKSEPTVKKRLEAQIADLTKRLESGDIQPKERPVTVPQSKEVERLEFERDLLQKDIRRRLSNLKPKTIFNRLVQDPFNAARNVMTAFDLSAVFRQGGFTVIGHPVRAAKALIPMFKAFASEKQQAKIDKEIKSRDNFPMRMKSDSFHAPIDGTYKLSAREESLQSSLIERMEKLIPGLAASNRAYVTFLNVLRADSWDIMAASLSKDGDVTLDEAKAVSKFVNTSTGRGTLGKFENAAEGLNVAFFAPRYVASRFQLLGGAVVEPVRAVVGKNKRVSRLIVKEYARYLIGMSLVYALASLTLDDEEFEVDPRSSDFGKIKVGETRLDPLSGISQITVLISRLISGKLKSSTTGKISSIRGDDVGFGKATAAGVIGGFLRYKLSPMFGTTLNVLTGETAIHEPFEVTDLPADLLIPISFGEISETMQAQGVTKGVTLSALAIFGMGVQTYGSKVGNGTKSKERKRIKF